VAVAPHDASKIAARAVAAAGFYSREVSNEVLKLASNLFKPDDDQSVKRFEILGNTKRS
jgi:hypothetical protein